MSFWKRVTQKNRMIILPPYKPSIPLLRARPIMSCSNADCRERDPDKLSVYRAFLREGPGYLLALTACEKHAQALFINNRGIH